MIYARSPPITVNTIRVIHRLEKMVKIVMASNITVNTNLAMSVWSLVTTINIKLVTLQLEKMVRKVMTMICLLKKMVKKSMASNIETMMMIFMQV